jgi:hypothetical protein
MYEMSRKKTVSEIGLRWVKRAAKEMKADPGRIQAWAQNEDFQMLAVFVLNAATTGKGD